MSRKLHDTKNDFKSRNILAFCLFVVLGILSVACVTKAVLLNGSVVQNQFTDYNVTSVFRQDLIIQMTALSKTGLTAVMFQMLLRKPRLRK